MELQSNEPFVEGYENYVKLFDALSHPMRIKIMGLLSEERQYVSELARLLHISRPLLYMHLKKLEAAGLVTGHHEISEQGKAMKYFEVKEFDIHVTHTLLTELSRNIPVAPGEEETL